MSKSILKASPTKIALKDPVRHVSEAKVEHYEPEASKLVVTIKLPLSILSQILWKPKSLFVKQVNSQKREKQVSNYMTWTLQEDRKRRHERRRGPLLSPIKKPEKETKRVAFDDMMV